MQPSKLRLLKSFLEVHTNIVLRLYFHGRSCWASGSFLRGNHSWSSKLSPLLFLTILLKWWWGLFFLKHDYKKTPWPLAIPDVCQFLGTTALFKPTKKGTKKKAKFSRTLCKNWHRLEKWWLRDGLPKKVAVLLDFVQMRGGGSLPKNFAHFTNCLYWVNLGMGREGETPAQIFWHIGVQKSGKSCPN